jgi:hypothetical protein
VGTGPPQSRGADYDSPTVAKSRTACPLTCLVSSIKGKVKKKYFAVAGCFLAFQPT